MKHRLQKTAKSARAWLPAALLAVLALGGLAAYSATAGSRPQKPKIGSKPAKRTNQTSATFRYKSRGATRFRCRLDAAKAYRACPKARISYRRLAPGPHTFRVRAVDKKRRSSGAATYSWWIDPTAPTVASITRTDASPTKANPLRWTVVFSEPVRNVGIGNFALVTSGIGAVVPSITSVVPSGRSPSSTWTVSAATTGTAGSNSGSVRLYLTAKGTIRDAANNLLGGLVPVPGSAYTFDTTAPSAAGISITRSGPSPTNAGAVTWTVDFGEAVAGVSAAHFSLAQAGLTGTPAITSVSGSGSTRTVTASTGAETPSGSGTLQLRLASAVFIADLAGNGLTGALPVSGATYGIDKLGPPLAFTVKPPDPNPVATSQFAWTSPGSAVHHYECSTENGPFGPGVPSVGGPPRPCASPLSYVVATTNNGQHQFAVRAYDVLGNFTEISYKWKVPAGSIQSFTMRGDATGDLFPGAPPEPIAVELGNPNSVPIYVTAVTVAIASIDVSGCAPGTNFELTQSDVSAAQPVQIPAGATVTLPAQGVSAPKIALRNLPVNQDACKNAKLTLSFSGSAHS